MQANFAINWEEVWGQWPLRRRRSKGRGGGPSQAALNICDAPGPPGLGGTAVTGASWLQGLQDKPRHSSDWPFRVWAEENPGSQVQAGQESPAHGRRVAERKTPGAPQSGPCEAREERASSCGSSAVVASFARC